MTPNPYDDSRHRTPQATALAIGRSLSRLYWHLVQWAFLDGGEQNRAPAKVRGVTPEKHHELAESALESIYVRTDDLQADDTSALQIQVREVRRELQAESMRPYIDEAIELGEKNVQRDNGRGYDSPIYRERGTIIKSLIAPTVDQLQSEMERSLPSNTAAWLQLGKLLDEGLCRPDVAEFVDNDCREVLKPSEYINWHLKQMDSWLEANTGEIDVPSQPYRGYSGVMLGSASRRPGELAASAFWPHDVRRTWRRLNLGEHHLNALDGLGFRSRADQAVALTTCVDDLFKVALVAAGEMIGEMQVDCNLGRIAVEGVTHNVSLQQAYLFKTLLNHIGEANAIPFSKLRSAAPMGMFRPSDKAVKYTTSLPIGLKELIQAKRHVGLYLVAEFARPKNP